MKNIFIALITVLTLTSYLFSQNGWVQVPSGTTEKLNAFFCSYDFMYPIWIVGNNGTLLKSTNDGSNWTKVTLPYSNNFNSIFFNDALTGYITGSNGLILKTTNSGTNWIQYSTGVTNNLNSLSILSYYIMWAAGDNGFILRTSNAGVNWAPIPSNVTSNLNDANYLTIVGDGGLILKTSDGGFNWITVQSGTNNNLNDITNTMNSLIFISGDNGTVLKSTDNGLSWLKLSAAVSNNLNSVWNGNTYYLRAVGQNGQYLKSSNNGATWNSFILGPSTNLNSIFFWGWNLGWAIGDNGLILKTNSENWSDSFKRLDANTISAWLRNNGNFNRNPFTGNAGFEWPKGTNKYARYSSGLWLGAKVGNDTLVALADYDYEYLPGYTDPTGNPQGKNDSNYRIYKLIHGLNDIDRQLWPNALLGNNNQGAPVYFDQISNSWKPLDFADQTIFYRFTDSYPESHSNQSGSTAPLKADVMKINFAFDEPDAMGNITYMHYTLINKSSQPWNNAYITLWTDDDLGGPVDDLIGCDTVLGMAYTYNGDNNDEQYGIAPPAVSFVTIRGPKIYTGNNNDTASYCFAKYKRSYPQYKNAPMSVFNTYFGGDPIHGDPRIYYETYRIMQGLGRNGTPWINPITNQPTKFVYSGDPVSNTGWIQQVSNDQRFMMSYGPVTILPNDTQMIVVAQVIARGTSNINSISVLRQYAQIAKDNYNNCFANVPIGIKNYNEVVNEFRLYQNYPNPFNPISNIKYKIAKSGFVTLKIYDVLGKEVVTLVNEQQKPGVYNIEFDGTNYASGLYFYELAVGDYKEIKKMVLIK
jgi:photosystem II stability/assembly factor-like uncharacterized protein